MTIYISQGRYTAAAIKGMSAKPEDHSEAVGELFAAAGARLISWYLTLGPYDWLIIAEAPDEPTMISAVLAAAAGGSLSDITTTVALTASDTTKAFQWAGELTLKFRSAGRAEYYGVGIDSGREIALCSMHRSATDAAGCVIAGGFAGEASAANHEFTLESHLVGLIGGLL